MIRKFQKTDTERVLQIWLNGNEEAHFFIPKEYWRSHLTEVGEQLAQAEVSSCRSCGIGRQLLEDAKKTHGALSLSVYQKNKRAVSFYLREGFSVQSEGFDENTGEAEYTMHWKEDRKCPSIIVVTDYSPVWEKLFNEEAGKIREILRENCLAIHHIGSTAVRGLKAKPIIDILPVVKDLKKVDAVADRFRGIGYEYLGEFGLPGRRYLRKGGEERTHQIHIFSADNSGDIERHLAVRDYLRVHEAAAREYGRLKEKLALAFPYDIDGYCDGKEAFVKELEKKAILWKQTEEGSEESDSASRDAF